MTRQHYQQTALFLIAFLSSQFLGISSFSINHGFSSSSSSSHRRYVQQRSSIAISTDGGSSSSSSSSFPLYGLPKQNRGESDMDYIKRLTDPSKTNLALYATSSMNNETMTTSESDDESPKQKKKKGTYQRIEEWDEQRKSKGEMSWEERVMFEGQRNGNQVRQNDILLRNLHTF